MKRNNKPMYVAHDCRNSRKGTCNNRWIDKDRTHVETYIPTWKWCKACCAEMGIDFDKQTPEKNNRLEEEFNDG